MQHPNGMRTTRRTLLLSLTAALLSWSANAQTLGPASAGAAPSPSPRVAKAWIANTGSDTVSVIDTSTDAVVATIHVGDSPMQIAIRPDQSRAYVTNFYSGSVSVIDTIAKTVVATIPVGTYPAGIAVTPNGARAYVVRDYNGVVVVLDLATNSVLTTIPVSANAFAGISAAAVSPDGTRAYVLSGQLLVIDTATNAVVDTIGTGALPIAEQLTKDGAFAHVVNELDGTVAKVDAASNAVVGSVFVGGLPGSISLTPDGARAYVTIVAHLQSSGEITFPASDSRVKVIDLASSTVTTTIQMSSFVSNVAVLPSGARAYVTLRTANAIGVVDTATNEQVATIPSGGVGPTAIAFCAR